MSSLSPNNEASVRPATLATSHATLATSGLDIGDQQEIVRDVRTARRPTAAEGWRGGNRHFFNSQGPSRLLPSLSNRNITVKPPEPPSQSRASAGWRATSIVVDTVCGHRPSTYRRAGPGAPAAASLRPSCPSGTPPSPGQRGSQIYSGQI